MASYDRIKVLPAISFGASDPDNARKRTFADNHKRTERFRVTVTGQVDITVAGTGLRNRGSILAAITEVGFADGGADKVVLDARLARFISDAFSAAPQPATRLANAGVQAATQLRESFDLWLASPYSMNPGESKYVEPNKQQQLEVFATPVRQIGKVAAGATGTISNLGLSVEQVYDDLIHQAPKVSVFVRQIVQAVPAAQSGLKIDLRGSRYLRAIAIQQDTSDTGEVSDIITNLVLRGDNVAIIGDRSVPFKDLVEMLPSEGFGGIGGVPGGYWIYDFQRYGRMSSWYNPYQDTNLRLELDVQPSASGANSVVRVALIEYERTSATEPDRDGKPPVGLP